MIKQGADMILAAILRALASEIFLRHSLAAGSADLVPELKEVKMRCFEWS
jgi:hypothetical protein